jgi:hypothetical protein
MAPLGSGATLQRRLKGDRHGNPKHLFVDERLKGSCVYCGGPPETVDHVPSPHLERLLEKRQLTAEEEVELGRRMELGRRALRELEKGVPRSEEHDRMIERGRNVKEAMILEKAADPQISQMNADKTRPSLIVRSHLAGGARRQGKAMSRLRKSASSADEMRFLG